MNPNFDNISNEKDISDEETISDYICENNNKDDSNISDEEIVGIIGSIGTNSVNEEKVDNISNQLLY